MELNRESDAAGVISAKEVVDFTHLLELLQNTDMVIVPRTKFARMVDELKELKYGSGWVVGAPDGEARSE